MRWPFVRPDFAYSKSLRQIYFLLAAGLEEPSYPCPAEAGDANAVDIMSKDGNSIWKDDEALFWYGGTARVINGTMISDLGTFARNGTWCTPAQQFLPGSDYVTSQQDDLASAACAIPLNPILGLECRDLEDIGFQISLYMRFPWILVPFYKLRTTTSPFLLSSRCNVEQKLFETLTRDSCASYLKDEHDQQRFSNMTCLP
ncbi:hypothetical protein VNI00_003748 [Paramarasmius palmivorus]|uniref:Uncharacterized protein n=1 Tax=Paramarasmius palmivorus TaxID=297713 RepID=A0AAW0DSC1_9AGAR